MSTQLDDAIKRTQQTLRPIFSKPKCESKYLAKPPFRFIHDIVAATMSSTGFPKNYFSIAELASKNLKDKASKVAFLNKLVYLVGVCNGKEIDVRPSKIIAGAEPIKTNILLTMFGKVAVNKDNIDHIGAIKHCQFGGAIGDFNRGKKQKKKTNSEDDDDEEETKDIDHDDDDETEERLELAIRRTQHNDGDFVHMEDNKNRTLDASSASKDVPLEDHEGSISDQIAESKEILESEMIREREDKENEEPIDSSSLKNKIQSCDGDPVKARKMLELIVTKPTCKEARLNKPPFKFLHDLVIAINKQSGMGLENIFSKDEMESSNLTTKETKVQFLEKLVEFVKYRTGTPIDLRPSLVAKGKEEETKNCHFFQILATLAMHEEIVIDSSEAKGEAEEEDNKEDNICDNDMFPSTGAAKTDNDELVPRDNKRSVVEAETKNDSNNKPTAKNTKDTEGDFPGSPSSKENNELNVPNFPLLSEQKIERSSPKNMFQNDRSTSSNEKDEGKPSIEQIFFGSDEASEEVIIDDLKNSLRPKTARRRPPRIREMAEPADMKSPNTPIQEKPVIFKEEAEYFNVEDDDIANGNKLNVSSMKGSTGENAIVLKNNTIQPIPFELDKIVQSIQSIARSAAPIGTIMDYLPTELNTMMKESEHWKDEYDRLEVEWMKASKGTNSELEPVQSNIQQIEDEISRFGDLIFQQKTKIAANEKWMNNQMKRICHLEKVRQ